MVKLGMSLIVLIGLGASGAAFAQDAAGRVVSVRGEVTVRTAASSAAAHVGESLPEGAQVRTGAGSAVRILLDQSTVLDLGADTTLVLETNRAEPKRRKTSLKLFTGKLWARVTSWLGGDREFEVESPHAVAGVRGTEFVIDVLSGETAIIVFDGSVSARTLDGAQEELIAPGLRGVVGAGGVKVTQQSAEDQKARGAASAGGRLSKAKEGQRFGTLGNVAKGAAPSGGDPGSPADALELLTPPLELDPGAEQTRIHGKIVVQ